MTPVDHLFTRIIYHNDEEAFQKLFFDFFAPLCLFAHRYITSKETCEDIVQGVFFRIWKDRAKLSITVSARNFLITTVRNACIDYLRHREIENRYLEKQLAYEEKDPMDTNMLIAVSELEKRVGEALAKLPDAVRRSFEMNRFDDKTYLEIASECEISVKTVEAHISRALKLLRVELKDYLPFLLLFV